MIPQDVEAERSLLATLCAPGNEKAMRVWLPLVTEDHFVDPRNRAMFQAIHEVGRREVSIPLLADIMTSSGTISMVGGPGGISQVLEAPEVEYPHVLIDILSRHKRQRELLRLANHIPTMTDPDVAIQETLSTLHRIAQDGRKDTGEGWDTILDVMNEQKPFSTHSGRGGGRWGIPTLDEIAAIPTGEFTVIGARPGIGKTAFMTQVSVESARSGFCPLVLTLELPMLSMKARIVSYMTGLSVQELKRGEYDRRHTEEIACFSHVLSTGRIQAPPTGTPWNKLEAMIRYEVDRYGVDLVLLDQFDKIGRPAVERGSTEAYAFGRVSQSIMGLCKELDIGFVLLCQLKGDADGREPSLSDHADSDRPGKDAAVVIHLWKTKEEEIRLIVQKNRDGGFVGKRMSLDFNGRSQRFAEIIHETNPTAVPQGW